MEHRVSSTLGKHSTTEAYVQLLIGFILRQVLTWYLRLALNLWFSCATRPVSISSSDCLLGTCPSHVKGTGASHVSALRVPCLENLSAKNPNE